MTKSDESIINEVVELGELADNAHRLYKTAMKNAIEKVNIDEITASEVCRIMGGKAPEFGWMMHDKIVNNRTVPSTRKNEAVEQAISILKTFYTA